MFSLYLRNQRPKNLLDKTESPKKREKKSQAGNRGEAEGPPKSEACQGWSPAIRTLQGWVRLVGTILRSLGSKGWAGGDPGGRTWGSRGRGASLGQGARLAPAHSWGSDYRRGRLPLPPLLPSFRPRLEQDGQSTPSSLQVFLQPQGGDQGPCPLG